MTRNEKQDYGVDKYINQHNGRGFYIGATGFGKTTVCLKTVKKYSNLNKNHKCNIVVPSIDLKNQWENNIIKFGLQNNCKVFIVNSYIKTLHTCDQLIGDECHLFTSPEADYFNKVIENTNTNKILFVSATLEEKHILFLLNNDITCVDIITREEAITEGWCSNYNNYILKLKLNEIDEIEHKKLKTELRLGFSFFQTNDFKYIISMLSNKQLREKIGIREGVSESYVFLKARNIITNTSKRKTLLQESDTKKKTIKQIVESFNNKSIIYGQSTKFSDEITNLINTNSEICLSVHSKKTSKQNKESLKKLTDNRYKIRIVSSAKKLTTGIDIPDLSLGIIASYNSSSIISQQIVGRFLRLHERKTHAIIITLCIEDSQEEKWLLKNKLDQNSKIVYSVNEILQLENSNYQNKHLKEIVLS